MGLSLPRFRFTPEGKLIDNPATGGLDHTGPKGE